MKSMWRAVILFSTVLIISPLHAFGAGIKPYSGAGIGLFGYDRVSDSALGLYVSGGADFPETKYFGAEVRLGTGFEAEKSIFSGGAWRSDRYDLDYFLSLLGRAKYAVTPEINVYGLIGFTVASWNYERRSAGGVLQLSNSGTDTDLSLGAGADYRLRDRWRVGVEWLHYNSDVYGLVGTVRYEY